MKDLLLLLCKYPYDTNLRESLSFLLRTVTDWPKLLALINAHGIIALAYYNIKESGLEKELPLGVMEKLENGYRLSLVRNTWLTESWKEVNKILTDAGIKHILLKGMALEYTVYGSRGLRQMNDNDIFIKLEESVRAWNLLQREGYDPEPLKSPLFRKIRFEIGRHLPALSKNGYVIEIHNTLFDPGAECGDNNGDPFESAIVINIQGTKAHVLSEEKHLNFLIKHFEHHKLTGECQLRLYQDIKLLDETNKLLFPDNFISDPIQYHKPVYRKVLYRSILRSVLPKHRFRYIIGDTFPSLGWMKKRYKCSGFLLIFLYPLRIGKLRWLV